MYKVLTGPTSTWEKLGVRGTFDCTKYYLRFVFESAFWNRILTKSLGPNFGFRSWVPNPKCSSMQVFQIILMSRVAKALLRHPACSVLLLSFGLMTSLVGVHDSKSQKIQKTVDVFTLAMSMSALPYRLGCTPTPQEGSPTMMMKAFSYSLGCPPTSQEGSPTMMMNALPKQWPLWVKSLKLA